MPGTIERRGDIFHFIGTIDENVPWAVVTNVGNALRCDFGDMAAINSVATAKFITLLQQYGHGKVEYHRCPKVLLNSINTVTSFLGTKRDASIVKSFFIDFFCTVCQVEHTVLVPSSLVQRSGNQLSMPPRPCPTCQSIMRLSDDLEDSLGFLLTAKA